MLTPENKKEAIMHGSSTDDQLFQCQLSAMSTEFSCIATYAIFCKILNPALLTTFFYFYFFFPLHVSLILQYSLLVLFPALVLV